MTLPNKDKDKEQTGTLFVDGQQIGTVYGYSIDTSGHSHTFTDSHSDTHTGTTAITGSFTTEHNSGDIFWDHTDNNWKIYGTFTTDGHEQWNTLWSGTLDSNYEPIWTPRPCECCEDNIMSADDECVLQIGDESVYFHRRCFADKENASFIRSLLISKDLDLV